METNKQRKRGAKDSSRLIIKTKEIIPKLYKTKERKAEGESGARKVAEAHCAGQGGASSQANEDGKLPSLER